MYMMICEDDMKTLQENTYKLMKKCAINGLNIKIADKMQENVFNSIMFIVLGLLIYKHIDDTKDINIPLLI